MNESENATGEKPGPVSLKSTIIYGVRLLQATPVRSPYRRMRSSAVLRNGKKMARRGKKNIIDTWTIAMGENNE